MTPPHPAVSTIILHLLACQVQNPSRQQYPPPDLAKCVVRPSRTAEMIWPCSARVEEIGFRFIRPVHSSSTP